MIKRILVIVGAMNAGGAETFIMKMFRNIDRDEFIFDFCTINKGIYDEEIYKLGGKHFYISAKSKRPLKNFFQILKIVKKNKYDYVLRISQSSVSSLDLFAAKLGGAKKLIFRSSNSNTCSGKFSNLMHQIFKPFANSIANIKIAPSKEAGEFMFGKNKYLILNNAVNYDDYKFDLFKRNELREKFGLEKKFVIGHVGRFSKQKNHKFIIELCEKLKGKNLDFVFVLVGAGELKQEIQDEIKNKNLKNYFVILPVSENVNYYYSLFDLFVLPSLYEGLPNVIVEAQASGLCCLLNEKITRDVKINDNIEYLRLDVNLWAENIIDKMNVNSRIVVSKKLWSENKFDINQTINTFENILRGNYD